MQLLCNVKDVRQVIVLISHHVEWYDISEFSKMYDRVFNEKIYNEATKRYSFASIMWSTFHEGQNITMCF